MLEAEPQRCKSEQVMPGVGEFRELNPENTWLLLIAAPMLLYD